MWQTTNALEALRLVASHNDAALSTSILSCVAGQSAIAGAAETALAMTLARPLLVAGNAPLVMKPVAALLNAARRHAQQHSEASDKLQTHGEAASELVTEQTKHAETTAALELER